MAKWKHHSNGKVEPPTNPSTRFWTMFSLESLMEDAIYLYQRTTERTLQPPRLGRGRPEINKFVRQYVSKCRTCASTKRRPPQLAAAQRPRTSGRRILWDMFAWCSVCARGLKQIRNSACLTTTIRWPAQPAVGVA